MAVHQVSSVHAMAPVKSTEEHTNPPATGVTGVQGQANIQPMQHTSFPAQRARNGLETEPASACYSPPLPSCSPCQPASTCTACPCCLGRAAPAGS
jgi:hypothetical protein